MRAEDVLVTQISTYLKMQYPKVLFHFDLSSGGKTSIGMAVRNKSINPHRGYPDLFIAEPKTKVRDNDGFPFDDDIHYCGLYIEIKVESPFKREGGLKAGNHLKEQEQMLHQLQLKGYASGFGVGFEGVKKMIDQYLSN